jgi:hypothetical protein
MPISPLIEVHLAGQTPKPTKRDPLFSASSSPPPLRIGPTQLTEFQPASKSQVASQVAMNDALAFLCANFEIAMRFVSLKRTPLDHVLKPPKWRMVPHCVISGHPSFYFRLEGAFQRNPDLTTATSSPVEGSVSPSVLLARCCARPPTQQVRIQLHKYP